MILKINGVQIRWEAIESLRYDYEKSEIVVRTISGAEYSKFESDKYEAEKRIESILNVGSVYESL